MFHGQLFRIDLLVSSIPNNYFIRSWTPAAAPAITSPSTTATPSTPQSWPTTAGPAAGLTSTPPDSTWLQGSRQTHMEMPGESRWHFTGDNCFGNSNIWNKTWSVTRSFIVWFFWRKQINWQCWYCSLPKHLYNYFLCTIAVRYIGYDKSSPTLYLNWSEFNWNINTMHGLWMSHSMYRMNSTLVDALGP